MITDRGSSRVTSVVAVNTFDDASMWVRDPASKRDRELGLRTEGTRINAKLWKRGKNVHLPVCTQTEDIFVRHTDCIDGSSTLRGASLHSPSQVLVEANTGAIRNRWKRWTAVSPHGLGSMFDPDRVLASAFLNLEAWVTVVVAEDNLNLNDCIMGMEESAVLSGLTSGLQTVATSMSYFHLSCHGHSAVLCTKQVTERVDDLPGEMVRMGHLHESGKTSNEHLAILKDLVGQRFRFMPVHVLPTNFDAWQAKTAHILKLTRPALDLTPMDEEFIMAIDNGDWDDALIYHWCLGPTCQANCGGVPDEAKRLMVDAIALSIGAPTETPLTYRWKGVEKFAAKLYRGRRQHDLWLESHKRLWPAAKVRAAEAALESSIDRDGAAANSNIVRYKQQMRGGKTVAFLESDPRALKLERLLVLNVGIQAYWNKCFAADAAASSYSKSLQFLSESDVGSGEDLRVARAQCISRNLHILSGSAGLEALALYSRFFFFSDAVWGDWRLDSAQRFDVCLDLICVMEDVAHRLVFKLGVPKLEIFEVCRIPEGDGFDETAVRAIATRLRVMSEQCDTCVDKVFTQLWVERLLNMGSNACRKAHSALCDVLATLRVTSTKVERKHLLGQESRPRKRGRAVECEQLNRLVFHKSIVRACELHREEAKRQCLGVEPHVRLRFARCLGDHLASGHRGRSRQAEATRCGDRGVGDVGGSRSAARPKALAFVGKLRKRSVRGYDIFISRNYEDCLSGETVLDKRRSLDARWKVMPAEIKQLYNAAAAQDTEAAKLYENEDFVQFLSRTEGIGSSTKRRGSKYLADRFRAVQATLKKMVEHKVFASGAQLHDFKTGFRPELVASHLTYAAARDESKRLFGYDFQRVPTPLGPCVIFRLAHSCMEGFVVIMNWLIISNA